MSMNVLISNHYGKITYISSLDMRTLMFPSTSKKIISSNQNDPSFTDG